MFVFNSATSGHLVLIRAILNLYITWELLFPARFYTKEIAYLEKIIRFAWETSARFALNWPHSDWTIKSLPYSVILSMN